MDEKQLRIRFDKIDEYINIYERSNIWYIVIFDYWLYDEICNRVYLVNIIVVLQIVLIIILEESEKINLIQNFFKWTFVYYKCYILIELTFLESAELVSYVPMCQRALCLLAHLPTWLVRLHVNVPTCLACLRPHVPTCLACLRASVRCMFTHHCI